MDDITMDTGTFQTMLVPFDPARPDLQRFNGLPDTDENRKKYNDAKNQGVPLYFKAGKPGGRVTKGSQDCCIDTYTNNAKSFKIKGELKGGNDGCLKCKKAMGFQAHHGMVDYPFRTGSIKESQFRAPGAPSYNSALTICVPSHRRPGLPQSDAELDEHSALHADFDNKMKDIQKKNGGTGLVTFGQVKKASFEGIDNLSSISTFCKELYKNLLRNQYDIPNDMLLRGVADPPPQKLGQEDVFNQLEEAWRW